MLFAGSLVYGVVAALSGRWLVALFSYVVAVASTLHIVAALDPDGGPSPAAVRVAQDAIVEPKPRTRIFKQASAGLAMKAGLVLTLPAAAAAATGSLPNIVPDWVADAVHRAAGLDILGGGPADERPGAADPPLAESVPENGPIVPEPASGPGPSDGPPPLTSPGDVGAPPADQTGPPDATSSKGPSEGGDRRPPPGEQQDADRGVEVPTGPPPLPVSPVLPLPPDRRLPEVGNVGGLGIGDQPLP
ncbi:MAG: hypothetical protein M3404_02115 [Actinomycetota bacterium]|nr:hypothetical protein [Actinomycetota bacterium]